MRNRVHLVFVSNYNQQALLRRTLLANGFYIYTEPTSYPIRYAVVLNKKIVCPVSSDFPAFSFFEGYHHLLQII